MAGRGPELRHLPEVCVSGCRGHQESGLRSWRELLLQIYYSTSANLSIGECAILIALWLLAWLNGKEKSWFPTAYSVFLILYIHVSTPCTGRYRPHPCPGIRHRAGGPRDGGGPRPRHLPEVRFSGRGGYQEQGLLCLTHSLLIYISCHPIFVMLYLCYKY